MKPMTTIGAVSTGSPLRISMSSVNMIWKMQCLYLIQSCAAYVGMYLILKTKFPLCSPDTVPNTEKYLRQWEAVK
jgi:hypothetical protein